MAMNPAAKDPNAFASTGLSGGGASNAILGVPQNPNMPRGPQPASNPQTPLAQANDAAFGPGYWNTISANGGSGLAAPDYASQIAAHNDAMIQQMQSQAQQPQQTPQLYYGVGPNNELQVGDQVVPMGDNPTSAAQAIQQNPGVGITQSTLKPGFRPVAASDINEYLSGIQHGTLSDLYQGGKELAIRTPGALLGSLGAASKWAGADTVGAGLQGMGQSVDQMTGADQPVDTLGRGAVGKWFVNNMAGAAQMVPFIAQSFLMPETAVPKALSILGDVALNFGLFGSQAAQEKKESLIAQGVDPAQANKAGWVDFFSTGGGMMAMGHASHAALDGTYSGAQQIVAKLKQAVGKGAMTAEEAAAAVTNPALLARTAANLAGSTAVQGAAMSGMAGASAASNNAYGGQHQDVGDAMASGLGTGLSLGVLTSPLGAVHTWQDSGRRRALGEALNTPSEQVDLLNALKQQQAAKTITPEVGALAGAKPAQDWAQGVTAKAFNAADSNQFRADQAAQAQAQPESFSQPYTPPEAPAAPAAPQENAAAQLHAVKVDDTLKALGVGRKAQKAVRAVAEDAVASGIDLESPQADTLVKLLKKGTKGAAGAQAELDRLKGQKDGVSGQPNDGMPPSTGAGGTDVGGGVADGKPAVPAGEPAGGLAGAAPEPAARGGEAVAPERVDAGAAPVAPKAEIPDFSGSQYQRAPSTLLERPSGSASLGHLQDKSSPEHIQAALEAGRLTPIEAERALEELRKPPEQTRNLSRATEEETGQGRLFKGEVFPKRPKLPKDTQRARAAVDAGTPEPAPASQITAVEAKQSRKRQETEAAVEAAKSEEQKSAEAAAKDVTVPQDKWEAAFGDTHGERIHRALSGETFGAIGADHGVQEDAVRKSLKRATPDSIDKAVVDGKIDALTGADMKRQLEKAQKGAVVRKTAAEANADGGSSAGVHEDSTTDQIKEIVADKGTFITASTKPDETAGKLKPKETLIAKTAQQWEEQRRANAGPKGDSAKYDEAVAKLKELAAQWGKAPKSDAEKLADVQRQIAAAVKDGGKAPAKLEAKRKALQEKLDAADEEAESEEAVDDTGARDQDEKLDALDQEYGQGMQFGKGAGPAEGGPAYTAAGLKKEISDFMGGRELPEDRIHIVDSAEDLEHLPDLAVAIKHGDAFGWTKDGRVVMIADRIPSGEGRAKFMHEVGTHLGLEHIMDSGDIDLLAIRIAKWADRMDGSQESELARRALERVGAAGTKEDQTSSETVAYFLEEATKAGIDPSNPRGKGEFTGWLRRIAQSFKQAVAKLLNLDLKSITPQDIVDMAYGAAHLAYDKAHPSSERSLKLSSDERAFFESIFNSPADLEGLHDEVPSARMEGGLLRYDPADREALEDYVSSMWGAGKKSYGGEGAASLPKSFANAGRKFIDRLRTSPDGAVKFGKNIERNISKLPERYQEPARNITDTLNRWTSSALDKMVFTKDLVERGVKRGMTALHTFDEHREARDALAGHYQKMAYDHIEPVRNFSDAEKRALSDFLQQSTLDKQWGYGEKAAGSAKSMYEALSPRAKKVAEGVFSHGDTILKEKKGAIQELCDNLYGSMIDDAKAAGHTNVVAELKAERDGFLKKYNRLMALDEGNPYVSLQRRGDFVAVGKSEEYRQAEAAAQAKGATKADRDRLQEMQTDPNHYLVSSAQSIAEAKVLRQNMRDAGFPATGDHTYYRPKSEWARDGAGGVIAGMGRLRNQLDMMARESANPTDRARYASMNHLLTNMWLDALSQRSARKAEMRRLGVHGTMDVVDSFRQSAAADAHFISGIKYNDKMLTALKQAREQADRGEGEDRTINLNMMDEFLKRHEQSTAAVPTPWANKITKTVALWQIATSPAHYIGNLMQPWTMTLPYLQAKHGYGAATSEFFKAYKEIGGILANTGVLNSLKVDDMPADVRQPMKRLLELGRLDIGMNTEYTSMDLNIIPKNAAERSIAAAADRITQASLKMESLNRLASAAAAYRLELKRTGDSERAMHYAADVVAETHGDHSRANAPRVFNSGFGKVALQFRKFQLVQLTQMAKMIGNLRNADPVEQATAVRMLGYTLAHVAALGGAVGMPGFGTFSSAAQNIQHLLGQTQGEDWETQIEKAAGGREMAQLLLRGLPGLAGVDLTSKVGYGDMLGIAPYTDVDVTDRKSVVDAIGQVTSGPFGGLMGRAAQSLHHVLVGNYYKGLEGLMPQGIANVMKGARELNEGVTNTKGDKLMNINAGEAMLEALGFEPSSKAMQANETASMINSTEGFKDRLEILKERYANDARSGGDVSSTVKNLNALRAEMQERGFRPVSLGDLIKAPMEQLKREMFTTPGGVQYNPKESGRAVAQLPK